MNNTLEFKVLETFNNGYGCGCCAREWDTEEPVKQEDMMNMEQIIDRALCCSPHAMYGDMIGRMYLYEEDFFYGYDVIVERNTFTIHIHVLETKYTLDPTGENGHTKEQLLKVIRNEFGTHSLLKEFL